MNQINQQIKRAQRKMILSQFVSALCICLFTSLMIAAIGIAIPKIWHIAGIDSDAKELVWNQSWIVGGFLIGILSSVVWTYIVSTDKHDAALEVDQRFKLKERLSSALSLSDSEKNSDAGMALINDANDRAETIEIGEQFQLQPNRQMLLPILPALLLAILFFVPNAAAAKTPEPKPEAAKTEIKTAVETLKKKLKKKIEEMEAKGLKNAEQDLQSLAKKIDNMSSGLKDDDKKDALVKLNNVKKQLEDRRKNLGGNSKDLKKQLNSLKQFNDGPAKKISKAINEGDFKEAKNAIKDLLQKIKDGKMSETEKKKLAKDLAQLSKDIKKMAENFEQKKQELKDQIKKANQQGDLEKAAKLQQKLEKMQQQDKQMQKMKKMAQSLKKCANCMKQGNGQPKQAQQGGQQPGQQGNQPSDAQKMQEAMESLEELEQMMKDMEGEMDELKDLEDMMEQIEAAKNECQGCKGGGKPGQKPKWQDWAKGSGRGAGLRDKQETDTGTYRSRVKGTIQKGETVVTGHADGKNISGQSISEVRNIAKASISKQSDPLENQKLPRAQRDHAQEYFESLRGK